MGTETDHAGDVVRPIVAHEPPRGPSRLTTRMERLLTGMADWPAPLLFGGFLVWFIGWSALAVALIEALVDQRAQVELAITAGDLAPAIGTLFAFLTGFVISSQWNRSRAAEGAAGVEADAATRLCYASRSPGIDGEGVRRRLVAYLRLVVGDEWHTLTHPSGRSHVGAAVTADALDDLEREVRREATADSVPAPVTTDLLRAAEGIAVARRDRLNLSGHGLPAPLFILVFIAGVVLSLDAVAIAVELEGVSAVVVGGLVVLIALDLALIVAISDPFRGPMRALPTSITVVLHELENGRFGPLAGPASTPQAR